MARKKNNQIDDILNEYNSVDTQEFFKNATTVINSLSEVPLEPARLTLDFQRLKNESETQSHQMIASAAKFFIHKDVFEDEYAEYIHLKLSYNKEILSSLQFQIKTIEYAIQKLIEEIELGNSRSSSFEALATLEKSKNEILKTITQFLSILENDLIKLKNDLKNVKSEYMNDNSDENALAPNEQPNNIKIKGGKDLIQLLKYIKQHGKE